MMRVLENIARRTPLGWLQLRHDWSRLLVAMAGITFADVLIFMQLGFMGGLFETSVMLHRRLDADVILLSSEARNLINAATFSRRRLYQAQDLPGVASADALYGSMKDWKHPITRKKTSMYVVGMNPDKPPINLPTVIETADTVKIPDVVLFDQGTRGEYAEAIAQVQSGETVKTEIDTRTVEIGGLFEIGASFLADGFLITSDQNFLRLFPQRDANVVSFGLLKVEPGQDPDIMTQQLNDYLPDDVQALSLDQFIEFEQNYLKTQSSISFVFTLGSMMGFVVGVVIVYQILSTDVIDHLGEYATFKAMGYQQRYLLGVIFEQALILSALGFLPGVSLSIGLYRLTRLATALPITMPVARVILVFVLNLVMCSLSGAIATRKLQAADPADMF